MDMNHDFTSRPDIKADRRSRDATKRIWLPERIAIAAILVVGWLTFMAQFFSGS